MSVNKSLNSGERVMVSLLLIGLVGLLFLIIFGQLSGNSGIADGTVGEAVTNETVLTVNATGDTLTGYNSSWSAITLTAVWNSTDAGLGYYNVSVPSAGWPTVSATGVVTNTTEALNLSLSYTYTYTYTTVTEARYEAVIGNLTGGATQFFSFSNVWFILTAVAILIGIVIGVIALVKSVGKRSKFSSY